MQPCKGITGGNQIELSFQHPLSLIMPVRNDKNQVLKVRHSLEVNLIPRLYAEELTESILAFY